MAAILAAARNIIIKCLVLIIRSRSKAVLLEITQTRVTNVLVLLASLELLVSLVLLVPQKYITN